MTKNLLDPWRTEPVAKIRRCGTRERGWMAWEAWVDCGLMRFAGEWGTYAWTRRGAEKKARQLMRAYLRTRRGPEIVVDIQENPC